MRVILYVCVFFCKQKTPYEMRISDWSSDVCSSDLDTGRGLIDRAVTATWEALGSGASVDDVAHALHGSESEAGRDLATAIAPFCRGGSYGGFFAGKASFALDDDFTVFEMRDLARSEEHTSELQSLMRIPYAVFCLKKQTHCMPYTISYFFTYHMSWLV